MNKVIRDGKVAVLISTDFGAGWYSWNRQHLQCLFDPEIVQAIEAGATSQQTIDIAKRNYGDDFYTGGASELEIVWLDEGTQFEIDEYDGAEGIGYINRQWLIA